MRRARWFVVCVACCVGALLGVPAATFGEEPLSGTGASSSGSLSGPFVISGSPTEAEQAKAAEEARRNSPEAVAARSESQTKYEGLNNEQAGLVDGEAFPAVVNNPAGGPPSLPSGEQIVSYEATNAAAIALPDGKRGVIEALGPIATQSGDGQFRPIDLALQSNGTGYAPANSDVTVQIPKQASSGVSMPGDGVSLTPVDAQGQPLSGSEGAQQGASVMYANTQTDTDTLAKPATGGFELDSLLRSVDSPTTLYFKVGMPQDAELVGDAGPGGGARVVLYGSAIARIAPISVRDAAGTGVPAKMQVQGGTLVVSVAASPGEYQYPIEVDPQAYDETLALPGFSESATETNLESNHETDWRYHEEPAGKFRAPYAAAGGFDYDSQGSITPQEHSEFRYGAHGQASVGFIEETSSTGVSAVSGVVTKLEFASHINSPEKELVLAAAGQQYTNVKQTFGDLWNESEKHYEGHNTENLVRIMQTATTTRELPAEDFFWFQLNTGTWVGINQKEGPSVSFNTSESTISAASGRQNVLYGSGGWLGETNGAVEANAKDPGLGVSDVKIKDLTAGPHAEHWEFSDPLYANKLCTGVWCSEVFKTELDPNGTYFTYSKEMAEGPNTFELCAEDEALMKACTDATVNVDNTPPREIKLSGLAETGAEISAAQHQITVEATDGTAPTPSSGIKSIQVFVDGKEIGQPTGFCSPGECTARGTWTIDGESLGSGEHVLRVVATSNAERGLEKEMTFAVRNATPVSVGPGTVDPVTGQFTLSASDADIAGAGSVSRTYGSRTLAAGVEGPLGSQWKLSAGGGISIKMAPNGNAELTSAGGGLTTFIKKSGKFTAPKGDENLTLEAYEKEVGKGVTEYLLKDPTAGTTDRFVQLAGSWLWVPSAIEGPTPTSTIRYGYQVGEQPTEYSLSSGSEPVEIAKGPDGNIWVTQSHATTVSKVTDEGVITEYKLTFPFVCPNYITPGSGKETGLWFTDNCDHQIGKITTSGLATPYNLPSGVELSGITSGPDGNVWFAMDGVSKVGKITSSGVASEYALPTGSGPLDIVTGPDGNLWFTDEGTSKIGKITTSGSVTEYALPSGSQPYNITPGPDGDLWFTDYGTSKIGKITTSGSITEYALPSGSGPKGITSGPGKALFFTDYGTSKVGRITTAGAISEFALAAGSGPEGITEGGDGNIWYVDRGTNKVGKLTPIVGPSEILGPVPANVSCGSNPKEVKLEELKAGCRALSFTYAEKTTAAGEGVNEWGEYTGRLVKVSVTAYNPNPSITKMETTAVAQYSYDSQGRLRAEWDPRISPALKMTYGYDPEGHVAAMTPPGQQPWVFTYGAIAGDTGTGRLLKVTRAHPNAGESEEEIKKKLAEQKEAPKNTTLPTLSGSPVVGVSMGASSGVWSNGHVAYAYQWDDCNTEGKGCTPIPGAVNASYTAGSSDVGRTLVAQVQAIDSGGAVSASSAASGVVTSSGTKTEGERYPPGPGSTIEYRVPVYGTGAPYQMTNGEMAKWGQTNDLPKEATAIFPPDEPQGWPASGYKRATVLYMDERARTTNTASPSGAISTAEYNTLNEVTRTLSASDRAIAMKEGCESELKCKSAEVAKNLSNEKIYNSEGSQLLETFGPEHKIKLASGTEEETRDRQKFSYNEGAPSSGEKYNLVTKSSSWAENSAKLELDKHEAVTAYSNGAQGELGWTLRKPLLVAETVDGKTVTQSTKYSSETGAPVEDLTATTAAAPVYSLQFGALGSGAGQFKEVLGVAVDPSGYVWAVDKGDHRVEKFTSGGLFVAAYGAEGTIGGDYKETWGIAVNQSTGNVYVTDSSDSRVEELNSSGAFVEAIGWGVTDGKAELEVCKTGCQAGISGGGNGEFNDPTGIAVDTHGNLWVADNGNNRIEELSEAGAFVAKFGSYGIGNGQFNGLRGIAVSGGNIYVADKGNARIEELSPTGTYLNQFGGKGTGNGQFEGPEGISADPVTGDLYVTDAGNPVQEFSPGGMFVAKFGAKGSGNEQFKGPTGVAVAASGAIYVADTENNRAQEWEPVPASAPLVTSQFGSKGSGEAQFNEPRGVAIDSSGNLWVADTENSRLEKLSASGGFLAAYGSHGSGSGQFSGIAGVAINQSTGNIYVSDRHNMRIEEFSSSGAFVRAFGFGVSDGEIKFEVCASSCRAGLEGAGNGEFHTPLGLTIDQSSNVWVADYGNNRVQEFTAAGEFVAAYGTAGTGNVQFKNPEGIVYDDGNLYVTDTYNARVEEISTTGAYVGQFGSYGTGKGQFKRPSAIAVNSVTGNLYVGDKGSARVEEFTPAGAFLASFGTAGSGNGQIGLTEVIAPDEIAINASGSVYAVDTLNNRVEKWTPAPRPGNEGAKNTRTIYYSAAANTEYPGCGSHPEWANLVCQTEPDVQPGDNGPPQLPVTTTTYNMWDEPETVTEKIGSVTRTTKKTYDSAGRLAGNEETSTSSENATLPAVTDEYSTETGAMTKESETLEGKAKTITSAYNTLGQLVTYTDGEGATTKYAYDIDGRVEEVSEPMGRQVYAYDTTTGFMTKLLDTAAGTFTATYGVSGEMLTEGYPNGIMAKYTYNTIGQATNLEYEKTTHCTEKCVWFSDAEAFGAKGEVMSQASTLSAETYSYNEEGQLTQTQETPVGGKGCITRAYGYDEEGERTSLTTREPNEKGECTSEGGLVEEHAYDDVGRLLDPGVTYDALGNMTRVPTVDAGGQSITSTFYVDNQVATQEQAGKTIAYTYDPAGRTLLAKKGKLLTFSHYAGPGEALTWTCEEEEGKKECEEQKATKWTRNIPGIGGAIGAIQTNGETPLLQLHDLQGNIVATVADSETVTGLGPTFNSTEYGVSGENKTPKYAWLGANGAESELETGVITKAGATYVPQLARTIQTETVIPPGAAPNGVMATEAYVPPELPWANQSGNEAAANTVAQQRTQERETMEATCRANPASCTVEEDPGWVWVLTIKQAYIIANAIFSAKAAESTLNFVDDVDAALNQFAGIDFIAQIEVAVEEGVFGFSRDEVEKWGLDLAVGLSNCVWDADVQLGKPDDPHCWVYVPTKKYHIGFTIFGQFIGFIFEIPEFKKYTQVGYCPHGSSYCYAV